ncbi:fumarylacetoacetate hydrolase family protein [Cupriavidus necator]|uniref:fumarylacetoacetate hydrolase family protein n=1 Tax=Cupriavidus necator TaxID=106590 RepID=UPI0005B3D1C3|nr:fumarylacetoacetate hydrolase family protein [Cupriavidus necator]
MQSEAIHHTVQALEQALQSARPIGRLTARHEDMTVDDAYAIQRGLIEGRLRDGVRVVGRKIGLTSRAAQQMLKVGEPDFGVLLSDMALPSGASIRRASLIAPKAEGEIAFVMRRDLRGPGVTAADVLSATEGVMACFEIVDSRIENWDIRLQDTVADNASSALFVLGDRLVDPRSLDLALAGMVLEKNGEVVLTGAGAAALGSPVNAVVWLANTLGRYGEGLRAGDVVLSGSLAAMVPVEAGDYLRVTIGGIGSCAVRFE